MEHPELCVTHPASPSTPVHPPVAWDVDNEAWEYDNYPLTQPSERALWSDDEIITTPPWGVGDEGCFGRPERGFVCCFDLLEGGLWVLFTLWYAGAVLGRPKTQYFAISHL